MKTIQTIVSIAILLAVGFCSQVYGVQVENEFNKLAQKVSGLELGLKGYRLGASLTEDQKRFAQQHLIEKTIDNTYKFRDGEVFVVAKKDDDIVLGIYKEFEDVSRERLKALVGDLMMRFHEPTTSAHEKIIYWAFGQDGHISAEDFQTAKEEGGANVLGLVKFVSSQTLSPPQDNKEGQEATVKEQEEPMSVYVIISSDPLSRLFLAMNN